MTTQEIICRICLKICDSSKALEGNMKDFLDNILPKTNLTAILEPMICTDCAEMLKKYFDFKAMCFNAHNIIPSVNNKNVIKVDLADVSLSRNGNSTDISEDQDTCGVCMTPLKNDTAIPLYVKKGDVTLEKMIRQCLPELDLNIIKKPAICASCHESLEMCFRFIKNCLIVEEEIKKYCESLDINSTDQIEVSSLLQFTIGGVSREVGGDSVDIIKTDKQLCEERKIIDNREIGKESAVLCKLERISCDDGENVKEEVVHNNERYVDIEGMVFNNEQQFTPNEMLAYKEGTRNLDVIKIEDTFCGGDEIKEENLVEMEDQKSLISEDIELKTDNSDFYRNEDGVVIPHQEIATRLHRRQECDSCSCETKCTNHVKEKLQKYKDSSEEELGRRSESRSTAAGGVTDTTVASVMALVNDAIKEMEKRVEAHLAEERAARGHQHCACARALLSLNETMKDVVKELTGIRTVMYETMKDVMKDVVKELTLVRTVVYERCHGTSREDEMPREEGGDAEVIGGSDVDDVVSEEKRIPHKRSLSDEYVKASSSCSKRFLEHEPGTSCVTPLKRRRSSYTPEIEKALLRLTSQFFGRCKSLTVYETFAGMPEFKGYTGAQLQSRVRCLVGKGLAREVLPAEDAFILETLLKDQILTMGGSIPRTFQSLPPLSEEVEERVLEKMQHVLLRK